MIYQEMNEQNGKYYANGISIAKYRITIILHPVIPNIIIIHLHHLCAFANVIITLLTI